MPLANKSSHLKMRCIVIILIIPLIFLWLISFREVRLKTGDYYYNQGKYEQAAKWYEKVMRKEKLNIDQNKGISND
jgi:ABC-type spermidine/putrescine transport system permease subunit II